MENEKRIRDNVSKSLSDAHELIATISQDGASKNFVGLPAYRLKQIASSIGREPTWVINQISLAPEDFVNLCNRFERDFIAGEFEQLEVEGDLYRQGRITDTISRAIVRGDLDPEEITAQANPRWKSEVISKVQDYYSGKEIFDGLRASDLFDAEVSGDTRQKLQLPRFRFGL